MELTSTTRATPVLAALCTAALLGAACGTNDPTVSGQDRGAVSSPGQTDPNSGAADGSVATAAPTRAPSEPPTPLDPSGARAAGCTGELPWHVPELSTSDAASRAASSAPSSATSSSGQDSPASRTSPAAVPPRASVCVYQAGGQDQVRWQAVGGHALASHERAALFGSLSWRPADPTRACTEEFGPLYVVSWPAGDGVSQHLVVEGYGCHIARMESDLTQPQGAPLMIDEASLRRIQRVGLS